MSEGDNTFRLGEAQGVGIGAIVVGMVACFTVVAVLAHWAIPDGMSGVKLFAKVAPMQEWEGFSGTTGLPVIVMILWHSIPL